MENQKPKLKLEGSVLSIVGNLHSHFRDMQSHYKMLKADLLSQLESMGDKSESQENIKSQLSHLKEIERKIRYFHILNNSISTVDELLHTEEMIAEFKDTQIEENF